MWKSSLDTYLSVLPMIKKIAYTWNKKTNMDRDDLEGELGIVFCLASDSYNETSKFLTWFTRCAHSYMVNLFRKELVRQETESVEDMDVFLHPDHVPYPNVAFKESMEKLPFLSKSLAFLLMSDGLAERVGVDGAASARKIRGETYRYLHNQGIGRRDLQKAFRTIREELEQ